MEAAKAELGDEDEKNGEDDEEMDEEAKEKAKKKAEKAARKAEKEAKKARKAEKEAKKLAKLKEEANGSKEKGDNAEDEDVVIYGAPDDHAWTDTSAALKDAEKNKKDDGPDLSVSDLSIFVEIEIYDPSKTVSSQ